MSKEDEFKITEHNPPIPEQILQDDACRRAWTQLIAGHIRRGLESGAWVLTDGRAIPAAMLHFYEEDDTMEEEEIMRSDCTLDPGSLVWGYARHSSGEKQAIDSQIKAIKDYCEEHDLILVHIFVDVARKGSTITGRDEFLAMIDAAHQEPRPVSGIVFWAFDRLFRGYDQTQFYKADLRLMGYELVSISEPLPEGPAGHLLEAAKDYMAKEELRKIAGRSSEDLIS